MTTPTPAPSTAPDNDDTDTRLAALCVDSGHALAGLIAAGLLHTLGRPNKLPTALFPDLPPDQVTAVWQLALTVGLYAGRRSRSPRFHRDELARIQRELADAGYLAMGALVQHTRTVIPAPEPHPADHENGREHW